MGKGMSITNHIFQFSFSFLLVSKEWALYYNLNFLSLFQSKSIQGFIHINGFNLGRYWPLAGPLLTMYLPKDLLKKENNSIVVVEMEQAPKDNKINFLNNPLYAHVISNEV